MDFNEKKIKKVREDLIYVEKTEEYLTLKDNSMMEQVRIHEFHNEEEARAFLQQHSHKEVAPKSQKQSKQAWKKKQKKLNSLRLNEELAKDMEGSIIEEVTKQIEEEKIRQEEQRRKEEREREIEKKKRLEIEKWAEDVCVEIENGNQELRRQRREEFKGNKYESAQERWQREDALEKELEEEKQQIRKELKEQLILKKQQQTIWVYFDNPEIETHLEEVLERQRLMYNKIRNLSLYYDTCEYMDKQMEYLNQLEEKEIQGKLKSQEESDIGCTINRIYDILRREGYIKGYEYYTYSERGAEQKIVGKVEKNNPEYTEESKVKLEEKYGKYIELNKKWGRFSISEIKIERNKITNKSKVYYMNGVYEYLGNEEKIAEYKKQEEWYRFLDETMNANAEIHLKLKDELGREYLDECNEKWYTGISLVNAFLHKKRIDWEKWYRKNADCYMNEQQQEEEEKRLRERKAEEAELCYLECEKMETDALKEQIKDLLNKPFWEVNIPKLALGTLKELNRVKKIMLHMKKEYEEIVAKLTVEEMEKSSVAEPLNMDIVKDKIKEQFKNLTFGEVWEALSKKQRIDLEKWYKKEADCYKPLIAKENQE